MIVVVVGRCSKSYFLTTLALFYYGGFAPDALSENRVSQKPRFWNFVFTAKKKLFVPLLWDPLASDTRGLIRYLDAKPILRYYCLTMKTH